MHPVVEDFHVLLYFLVAVHIGKVLFGVIGHVGVEGVVILRVGGTRFALFTFKHFVDIYCLLGDEVDCVQTIDVQQ